MSKIQSATSTSPLSAVDSLQEMSPSAAIGAEAVYGSDAGALDLLESSGARSLDVLPFSLPEGTGTAAQAEGAIAGQWMEMLADGRTRKHDTDSARRVSLEDKPGQWTETLPDGRTRKHDTDSARRVSPEDKPGQWTETLSDGRTRKHDTESVGRVAKGDQPGQRTETLPDGRTRKHDTESVGRVATGDQPVEDAASALAAKIADVAGAEGGGSALTEKLRTLQGGMKEHLPARLEAAKAAAKEARDSEGPGKLVEYQGAGEILRATAMENFAARVEAAKARAKEARDNEGPGKLVEHQSAGEMLRARTEARDNEGPGKLVEYQGAGDILRATAMENFAARVEAAKARAKEARDNEGEGRLVDGK